MSDTPEWGLWVMAIGVFVASVWMLGWRKATPVLVWIIFYFWIEIIGDLIVSAMSGRAIEMVSLAGTTLGEYEGRAIVLSLVATLALAFGMRCGLGGAAGTRGDQATSATVNTPQSVSLMRAVIGYFATLAALQILGVVAKFMPAISQPVLALGLIRYVFIYLIAATVFEARKGYFWLFSVLLLELATGMVSFFASYKEAIFVMLLALASRRHGLSVRQYTIGVVALVVVFWISMVWSGFKTEYRQTVAWKPLPERVAWLNDRYFNQQIDYDRSATMLFERVGYTKFYGMVLMREDAGILLKGENYYLHAVEHVLTPRVLFPDKAALGDSVLTTRLLGIPINPITSIGVGFVTEAHVDFGFPVLLAPIWAIGALIGLAARYFLTRPQPEVIRMAFLTAATFLAFPFAANIDKALGGFIVAVVAMALAMKFGYPQIAAWLSGGPLPRRRATPRKAARAIP